MGSIGVGIDDVEKRQYPIPNVDLVLMEEPPLQGQGGVIAGSEARQFRMSNVECRSGFDGRACPFRGRTECPTEDEI